VPDPITWSVRVSSAGEETQVAYARNHTLPIGRSASFQERDPNPSAVELFLAALGGDIASSFNRIARRRGISVVALEASVLGQIASPLVVLGVIGESGDPGFEEISCTLYVTADAEDANLRQAWEACLTISPIVSTLRRAIPLQLTLQIIP